MDGCYVSVFDPLQSRNVLQISIRPLPQHLRLVLQD